MSLATSSTSQATQTPSRLSSNFAKASMPPHETRLQNLAQTGLQTTTLTVGTEQPTVSTQIDWPTRRSTLHRLKGQLLPIKRQMVGQHIHLLVHQSTDSLCQTGTYLLFPP